MSLSFPLLKQSEAPHHIHDTLELFGLKSPQPENPFQQHPALKLPYLSDSSHTPLGLLTFETMATLLPL